MARARSPTRREREINKGPRRGLGECGCSGVGWLQCTCSFAAAGDPLGIFNPLRVVSSFGVAHPTTTLHHPPWWPTKPPSARFTRTKCECDETQCYICTKRRRARYRAALGASKRLVCGFWSDEPKEKRVKKTNMRVGYPTGSEPVATLRPSITPAPPSHSPPHSVLRRRRRTPRATASESKRTRAGSAPCSRLQCRTCA